jgi:hypothetical protein
MRPRFVKSFLALTLCLTALSLGAAAPASAAAPCWKVLINDWYDGRIDDTYPPHCYRDAVEHLPQDADTYSSAKDDIERALLARLKHSDEPSTYKADDPVAAIATGGGSSGGGSKGIIIRTIEWLGPSNAGSVPLPLLVLAGVAFLLLAAAGGSFVNRRLQGRRLPPPQA